MEQVTLDDVSLQCTSMLPTPSSCFLAPPLGGTAKAGALRTWTCCCGEAAERTEESRERDCSCRYSLCFHLRRQPRGKGKKTISNRGAQENGNLVP